MGVVYEAEDLELGETIAIKVLIPGRGPDGADMLARFKREVTLARKIKHPNVAGLHEFGTSGDLAFITMEFVPGRTLLSWLRELGRFAAPSAVSVLRQLAFGAHAAHRLGIVHRDLKSANVMLNEQGQASILDFGLARGRGSSSGDISATHILGTPGYMAPEQVLGREVDARTDVYAIGIIAFEILTGTLPYTGEGVAAVALKHVNEPLPDTLDRVPMPTRLREIVKRALSKEPEDRPAGARELAEELRGLPGGDKLVPPRSARLPATASAAETPTVVARSGPRARQAADVPAAPATVARRRRPVVIVGESDPGERARIVEALEKSGCETVSSPDGASALDTLRTRQVDLLVLAVALPGLDGFDVARVLKSDPKTKGIPVLLVTQRLTKEQSTFAQQVGAVEILARPQVLSALAWKAWRPLKRAGFLTPEELESARRKGRAALEGKDDP
jgi:CheY-like chemotaxis protein